MSLKCRCNLGICWLQTYCSLRLHREVESFVHWVSPTPVEDEVRGLIIDHIAVAVKTSFRDAQVFPFGSYQTKLYLPTGYVYSRPIFPSIPPN